MSIDYLSTSFAISMPTNDENPKPLKSKHLRTTGEAKRKNKKEQCTIEVQ